jgi:protein-S-isoprenylcysteine O-methyltransferase Ste14
MGRVAAVIYGVVVYVLFLAVFIYAIGFVGGILVPKSVDSGTETSMVTALVIDALLLALFAIQHSVMARQWFKRAWTKVVPEAVERSTYVLLASLALILLYWQWQPMTGVVWEVVNPAGRMVLLALSAIGWVAVLVSTCLVDHSALFGLKQVYQNLKRLPAEPIPFKTPALYKMVRHPIYGGFVIAFWSTPRMTVGHLFFAIMTTAYILVAIQFEERDLIRLYGERYREYRQRVGMLIPLPWKR